MHEPEFVSRRKDTPIAIRRTVLDLDDVLLAFRNSTRRFYYRFLEMVIDDCSINDEYVSRVTRNVSRYDTRPPKKNEILINSHNEFIVYFFGDERLS